MYWIVTTWLQNSKAGLKTMETMYLYAGVEIHAKKL